MPVSHLNMRLKMGDARFAAAAYLRLLEAADAGERCRPPLTAAEFEHVRSKLREANRRVAESLRRESAALSIQRVARGRVARTAAVARRQRRSAAKRLQGWWLNWLWTRGRGAEGVVTYAVLLRLAAPPAVSTNMTATTGDAEPERSAASAAEVLVTVADPLRSPLLKPSALSPFAALALPPAPTSRSSGALPFVITTSSGKQLHGAALSFAAAGHAQQTSAAPSRPLLAAAADPPSMPLEVLVLLGPRHMPRALEAAAFALMPAALSAAMPSMGSATSAAAEAAKAFYWEAKALIMQRPPRATGQPCSFVLSARTCLTVTLPAFPAVATARSPMPPSTDEAICDALVPLGGEGLATVLTALLLERKVLLLSARATRLTAAAHALTTCLFPLVWTNVFAPVLPPSHVSVIAAPFPCACSPAQHHHQRMLEAPRARARRARPYTATERRPSRP